MGFWRSRPGRPNKRELALSNNAAHRFYAAATPPDKDQSCVSTFIQSVAPKRAVRRPVDGQTVKPSEYQEQGAVIDWWWKAHKTFGLPVFALFSVPNGAYLANGYMGAAMLKKAGMRPGAPDLILAKANLQHHGLFLEMKSENGAESEEQREFGRYLETAGYRFQFCYGAQTAIDAIKEYLA